MNRKDKIKTDILKAGLEIWKKNPNAVNARNVAKMINKTHPTVYHYYPTKRDLVDAIAKYAVDVGDSFIIVSLMLASSPFISGLSEKERQIHLSTVSSL